MGNTWKNLFDLVKTMSPSEKGYFRKYQTGYADKSNVIYLKLFDSLAAAKELNEKQIEATLSGKVKNIHSIKSFLEKQILKSLRAYHHKINIAFTLREMLDEIEILNDRSLQHLSMKLIEKGISIAERTGMSTYLILFLIEKRQILKFYDEHSRKEIGEKVVKKITTGARLILAIEQIRDIHQKSIYWINHFVPLRDAMIRNEAESALEKLLLIQDETLVDFNQLNFRDSAISNIYLLLDKMDLAIQYQRKTISLLETVDLKTIKRQLGYASAVYNLCSLFIQTENINGVSECIMKLEHIDTENPAELNYIDAIIHYIRLAVLVRLTKKWNENEAAQAEKYLLRAHPIPNLFYDSQYLLLTYYVTNSEWDKALDKANYLLSHDNLHSQISIHVHARLLHILIHYKLQHTQLLPALIRQTYRYMFKQELYHALEKEMLNFFKKVLSAPDKTSAQILLKDLRLKVNRISRQEENARIMAVYFDYKSWLRKELRN